MKNYDELIFSCTEKKKEWENLPEEHRARAQSHLKECISQLSNQHSLELICHVINDLGRRVQDLEKKEKCQ